MDASTSRQIPVWERPEVIAKVKEVRKQIYATLAAKNLYKWREFVSELQNDIEAEIYKYEQLWLDGKYVSKRTGKPLERPGVGAYLNMAMQGAMNYVEYWMAKKRCFRRQDPVTGKDWINPETRKPEIDQSKQDISLDYVASIEGRELNEPLPIGGEDKELRLHELMLSIQMQFGDKIHKLAQRILDGESLSKQELEQLRTPEMLQLLTESY